MWQNLCWVDLLPPPLLLAPSTPLGDIMAGDSSDRLGFKVTVAVEAAPRRPMSPSGALLAIFNLFRWAHSRLGQLNSALLQLSTEGAERSSLGSLLNKMINLRCHLFPRERVPHESCTFASVVVRINGDLKISYKTMSIKFRSLSCFVILYVQIALDSAGSAFVFVLGL